MRRRRSPRSAPASRRCRWLCSAWSATGRSPDSKTAPSAHADRAAVAGDGLTDHVLAGAGGEEDGEAGDVLRRADPAAGIAATDPVPVDSLRLAAKADARRQHPGREGAWRDDIDQDALLGEVRGQEAAQLVNSALGGAVGKGVENGALQAVDRADVDDSRRRPLRC